MKPKAPVAQQTSFLMPTLAEQCDPRQPLKQLADVLPWDTFESAFAQTYSEEGRPAKPVRLMVGLLLLKQLENLSDETVVARWVQNPYYRIHPANPLGMGEAGEVYPPGKSIGDGRGG